MFFIFSIFRIGAMESYVLTICSDINQDILIRQRSAEMRFLV